MPQLTILAITPWESFALTTQSHCVLPATSHLNNLYFYERLNGCRQGVILSVTMTQLSEDSSAPSQDHAILADSSWMMVTTGELGEFMLACDRVGQLLAVFLSITTSSIFATSPDEYLKDLGISGCWGVCWVEGTCCDVWFTYFDPWQ